jgi:hypothetical protein
MGVQMNDSTRRGFLGLAGAGALAGAAVLTAPGAGAAFGREDVGLPAGAPGSMAAYIHDLKRGELALMVDGREVLVTDKQVVARLARAFAQAEHG